MMDFLYRYMGLTATIIFVLFLALLLWAAGKPSRGPDGEKPIRGSEIPYGVTEMTLPSGTKCAVYNGRNKAGIDCYWGED